MTLGLVQFYRDFQAWRRGQSAAREVVKYYPCVVCRRAREYHPNDHPYIAAYGLGLWCGTAQHTGEVPEWVVIVRENPNVLTEVMVPPSSTRKGTAP